MEARFGTLKRLRIFVPKDAHEASPTVKVQLILTVEFSITAFRDGIA